MCKNFCLLYRLKCFTGKFTTGKIHRSYTWDLSGLFSINSHVSLSVTLFEYIFQ